MKRKFNLLCVFIYAMIGIFCISNSVFTEEQKVLKLKYSNFFPPVHPISKLAEEWCKEIEKATGGRVTFSYYPGNTLMPPTQSYDGVVKGIADLGESLMAYSAGRFPLSGVFGLPVGFSSGYQVTKCINVFYKKFQPKELSDTKVMYLHGHGPGLIHTKKVIASLDDIKGMRIKVNAENAEIVKVLGGAPVTMPITEAYDALSKGLLEGLQLPMDTLEGWKFGEITKCTIINNAMSYTAPMFVVMNKEKWNLISKADQIAIEKINERWIEKQANLWNAMDKSAEKFALSKGAKIIRASKADVAKTTEKMKAVFPVYLKDLKVKGLPGDEALKFVMEYIKKNP
ncbi:MAG: TRAP transporter substrate-binding protein [Spirochaetota bacterium]